MIISLHVLRRISKVVISMQNFLVVLALFVFLFALIGMSIFANRFHFDANGFVLTSFNSSEWEYTPDQPHSTFDTFTLAFLMVFQIITIDNWSIAMFNCGRAVGPVGIVLPVIVFLLGTFFITNLFSPIIVNNFLEGDDETKPPKENPVAIEKSENTNVEVRIPIKDATVRNGDESHDIHNLESEDLSEGKSRLNLLSSSSKVAHDISSHILNHELFEVSITVIVCVSCVSLALDKPLNDPNSLLVERIYYVDLIVTIIFTVEMLFKVLVFGAFQKRGISDAYFRNAWGYFFSLYLSRIF